MSYEVPVSDEQLSSRSPKKKKGKKDDGMITFFPSDATKKQEKKSNTYSIGVRLEVDGNPNAFRILATMNNNMGLLSDDAFQLLVKNTVYYFNAMVQPDFIGQVEAIEREDATEEIDLSPEDED